MGIHRFGTTPDGFNEVLNGLRCYADVAGAEGEKYAASVRIVEKAFDDLLGHAILRRSDFTLETREVHWVNVSATDDSLSVVFRYAEWVGLAMDKGYKVNYADTLIDQHFAWIEHQKEKAANEAKNIREGWEKFCEECDGKPTKKAFSEKSGYSYHKVLEATRQRSDERKDG